MKILVLAKGRGAPAESIQPHIKEEIQAVWDLYAEGVCREFYARADQPGPAILLVESASVDEAKKSLAKLPLVALNLIDLDLIPLAPFTGIARLFQAAN
jgi:hypothetical protein